jgi:hypothetical protein
MLRNMGYPLFSGVFILGRIGRFGAVVPIFRRDTAPASILSCPVGRFCYSANPRDTFDPRKTVHAS